MAAPGIHYRGVVPITTYPDSAYPRSVANVYRVRIGDDDNIITTVTDSPVQIRRWTFQARERISSSRCIGLTVKTAQWKNNAPRAVICAVSVGDICLVVRLSKKSKAIPSPLIEFLLQEAHVFAGISIQDSLRTLLQGITDDGEPKFCNINVRAVERYNDSSLIAANQYLLEKRILNQIPIYPRPDDIHFDTNFDRYQLQDSQIAGVAINSYLAFSMGQVLLGPEQGMKEEEETVKMEKGEGPEKKEKRVKMVQEGGGPEKKVKMVKKKDEA